MPLVHIICNNSLCDCALPDCEILAAITPILTRPSLDPDAAANYRPLSNITFLSKLIEHLVFHQLTAYLLQYHFLPPQKSVYHMHHSNETATLKVASDIFSATDSGYVTILALLDFSAAFTMVNQRILLQRLSYLYSIGSTPLRWIHLFLSDRTQVVNFSGQQSAQSVLLYGVPQGLVSRPILFTLYMADVIRITLTFSVNVLCYADDLQLYIHCWDNEAAAVALLIACIVVIETWMGSNHLKMNAEITQFIWLGSQNQLAAIHIAPLHLHDGTVIAPSINVYNLRAIFDCEMTMSDHVNSVTHTCFY